MQLKIWQEGHALYPVVFLTTCADTRQELKSLIELKETYNIMRERIKMKIDFRTHCSSVWPGLRKSVGLSNNSNSQSREHIIFLNQINASFSLF